MATGSELERKLYELAGYMVTSARNLLDETPLYGPFRLIDATSRLIAVLEEEGISSPRLSALREKIEAGKYTVADDPAEFGRFLDDLVRAVVDSLLEGGGGSRDETCG
jgi:hypothetical protein